MKKLLLISLAIIVFTMVMTFISSSPALEVDYKNYFPLAQGNRWTYLTTDGKGKYTENRFIEGEEIVDGVKTVKKFYPNGVEYECIAADSEGIRVYKEVVEGKYEIFKLPFMILPNDIDVGKFCSYSIDSDIYLTNGSEEIKTKGVHQCELIIQSIENVEVPAGVFTDCLKIWRIFKWSIKNGRHGTEETTTWLAPGVGEVKILTVPEESEKEVGEKYTEIETSELKAAVINGQKIGANEDRFYSGKE